MKKNSKPKLITIKVEPMTAKNLNLAAALAQKYQYEVAREGSEFILGKYLSQKQKK